MSSIRNFNTTGWVAIFDGTETLRGRQRDVDGWDAETGTALVVDPERGVRQMVTDYPDFSHLERAGRVVTALPGAGWRVRGLAWGDEAAPIEEVLAWLVASDGRLTAVTVDGNRNFSQADDAQWCFPPGEEVTQ